ncbi:MAG: TonB-dependent receptor [Chitinophagaceae bacterium]|nr:TonB-dependent receptor [Chitinophagaceae bacterium]
MKTVYSLVILFSFWYSEVNGQTVTDTTLNEVIVTATRQNSSPNNLPYSLNRITITDIRNYSFRTTPEALSGSIGIYVQKTNHGGGSPFIRALTGNQNLLLIDGIRMNNSTYRYGPNQYMNTIDLFSISSIEVVRGSGSVQYGSDAMGGVIQVLSKSGNFSQKPKWGLGLIGKIVSADMEYSGSADVSYQSNKFNFIAGITTRKFGDLLGGDSTGIQTPSGYKEQAYNLKANWQLNKKTLVTLASQQTVQKDIPLFHKVKLENYKYYNFSPQKYNINYARLEINNGSKLLNKVITTVSYQSTNEQRNYLKNGNSNRFEEIDRVKTIGVTTEIDSKLNRNWSAISGIEWYHDQVNSSKEQINIFTEQRLKMRGLYPDNAKSSNFSIYSLHQFLFGKFQLNTGLRYNSFALRMQDTAAGVNQLGQVIIRPSSFVGNIALLYHLIPNHSIYASFNTGYRAPNVDDMGSLGLVDFRYEIPAYGLKPEKTYNSEIGYKIEGKKIRTSIALFYMHLKDLVNRVQIPGQQIAGYNVYVKENNQESYIRGSEMELAYKLSNQLEFISGCSYTFGQNITKNEPMRRVPPFNGRILLKYSKQFWNIYLEDQFAGKQTRLAQGDKDDNRIPVGGTPGWNVINLYSSIQVKSMQIQIGLGNLLNADYRMHGSGINSIGRNFNCSIYYKL